MYVIVIARLVCDMVHTQHDARGLCLLYLTLLWLYKCSFGGIRSWLVDGIDVGMSSIAPKCFCLCARDFIECSCPDIRTCSKCRSECLNREAPKSKKSALALEILETYLVIASSL